MKENILEKASMILEIKSKETDLHYFSFRNGN